MLGNNIYDHYWWFYVTWNWFWALISQFFHLRPSKMPCIILSRMSLLVRGGLLIAVTEYPIPNLSIHFAILFADKISSKIELNRTDASLNCASGFMSIDLQFRQKFYGIVYAQLDRNSACKVSGNGEETAKIQIPLKGCGTKQVRATKLFWFIFK